MEEKGEGFKGNNEMENKYRKIKFSYNLKEAVNITYINT